eukprot:2969395-Rhodomonas_salina.2
MVTLCCSGTRVPRSFDASSVYDHLVVILHLSHPRHRQTLLPLRPQVSQPQDLGAPPPHALISTRPRLIGSFCSGQMVFVLAVTCPVYLVNIRRRSQLQTVIHRRDADIYIALPPFMLSGMPFMEAMLSAVGSGAG